MESKIKTMRMQRMPGVTVAAFIMGYIDVLNRFFTWVYGGGRTIPIFFLITIVLVIAANNKQQWARVAWSAWIGFGVFCGVACLLVGQWPLVALASIAISIALLVCLWHPKTNDWFRGGKVAKVEAVGEISAVGNLDEDSHKGIRSERKTSVAEEFRLLSKEETGQTEWAGQRIAGDKEVLKGCESEAEKRSEGFCRHLAAMFSKIANSDGLISEAEVKAVEGILSRVEFKSEFQFDTEKRNYIIGIFNYARDDPYSIFTHADYFCLYAKEQSVRVRAYKWLWDVACADGLLRTTAKEILRDVCCHLQIPSECFEDNFNQRKCIIPEEKPVPDAI